jgi:hypothetical protein
MKRVFKQRQFPATALLRMFHPETEDVTIAETLGIHPQIVRKWRYKDTHINQWFADKYAIRMGLHPSAVWYDWFELEAEQV